MILCFFLF